MTRKGMQNIFNNPSMYLAAIIGELAGMIVGSVVGAFIGGVIAYQLNLCSTCSSYALGINPGIIFGISMGFFLGATLFGCTIGLISTLKMLKKSDKFADVSQENIMQLLLMVIKQNFELVSGMGVGAIVGSLKTPGVHSIMGAFIGLALMLFTSSLEKKPK